MKKLFVILPLFALLASVSRWTPFQEQDPQLALSTVYSQFKLGLETFYLRTQQLNEACDQFQHKKITLQQLQRIHLDTRLAFKSVEFLLEYNDRELVKKTLNGPPLPSLLPNMPKIVVLEPIGLQVLDDLLFVEEADLEIAKVDSLAELLQEELKKIKSYQLGIPLQHRFVFEASRLEINRVFTLGLTGFDTPGSANAIPEAGVALNAVSRAIAAYYPLLEEKKPELVISLKDLFSASIQYLAQNDNFETFDRLHFLKTYLNPLYQKLYLAHRALGIELNTETTYMTQAVNYTAQNIFEPNLLNPIHFGNAGGVQLDSKKIELGRLLFFDPILSSSNKMACASCHQPERAFTDGLVRSKAADGAHFILRNAPTLINAVFAKGYFYDLREQRLDRQIKHVTLSKDEFNTDFLEMEAKLNQSAEYRRLFAEAFPELGQRSIAQWSISSALGQYISNLVGFNSPFDQYVRAEKTTYPVAAARGFNLFMGKAVCGTCHFAPTFSGLTPPFYQDSESEVIGVPATNDKQNPQVDPDLGRYANHRPEDEAYFYQYSFKTVTVRNVALTAPYMHNGVYKTLEEVMDFYNLGGGQGLGIKIPHQTLPFDNLQLKKREIKDIIAFMQTLTDTTGLTRKPAFLPKFEAKPEWNQRKLGGE
jgi:cytochrome c peroxidase